MGARCTQYTAKCSRTAQLHTVLNAQLPQIMLTSLQVVIILYIILAISLLS